MNQRKVKLGASLIALMAFSTSLLAQGDIASYEAIERQANEMMVGAQRNAEAFDRRQDARAQEDRMERVERSLDSIQHEQARQSNDAYWHQAREFRESLDRR